MRASLSTFPCQKPAHPIHSHSTSLTLCPHIDCPAHGKHRPRRDGTGGGKSPRFHEFFPYSCWFVELVPIMVVAGGRAQVHQTPLELLRMAQICICTYADRLLYNSMIVQRQSPLKGSSARLEMRLLVSHDEHEALRPLAQWLRFLTDKSVSDTDLWGALVFSGGFIDSLFLPSRMMADQHASRIWPYCLAGMAHGAATARLNCVLFLPKGSSAMVSTAVGFSSDNGQ
ncbi:hypothetical protein LZ30DRAFT_66185 [Colletotrichum cereale]|nr:hypothetical protein LZ30DRAFT_66185 [Colletotrichum cereale]